jgi:hypothetical protein
MRGMKFNLLISFSVIFVFYLYWRLFYALLFRIVAIKRNVHVFIKILFREVIKVVEVVLRGGGLLANYAALLCILINLYIEIVMHLNTCFLKLLH